jgi:small subunit ribosomal protein S17
MSKDTAQLEKKTIKRMFEGVVVGEKANKTVSVEVKSIKMHTKYRKQYVTSKKYAVHDEKNESRLGDTVAFTECRPMSKTKRWRLTKVVRNAA